MLELMGLWLERLRRWRNQSAEASVASNDDARSSTSSARSSFVVKEKPTTPDDGPAPWRPPPAPEWPNATSAGP
jgi:hypothetical protein